VKKVVVVSPHPDDETLGCGGTLLKHFAEGDQLNWINVTNIHKKYGYSEEHIQKRKREIEEVKGQYGFSTFHNLDFPTTRLDVFPIGELIGKISQVFKIITPEILYLPFRGDIHTDHKVVFDAVASCTKWFRYPSVKRVLVYETLSETDFHVCTDSGSFHPNVFVDIHEFIEQKLEILNIYSNEIGEYPFPRSKKAVRSLAAIRGVASGFESAEAFMLLKERIN
jgi:N-acetylglucosamine malate deacetylase 1